LLKNYLQENKLEAGCDEAGRGCLAGPVCAAAVIMPPDFHHPQLNDSKKMSVRNRMHLRKEIEDQAIDYAVVFINNRQIDDINILKASLIGMHKALDKLSILPDHILVDGNKFIPYRDIPHTCVVKGDGKYVAIAAASVLAKTYRDAYMQELHEEYAMYGWQKNKGYPTKLHREAIVKFGITPYHRRSFQLTNTQMEIDFSGKK
jgi:ribonuclease HII